MVSKSKKSKPNSNQPTETSTPKNQSPTTTQQRPGDEADAVTKSPVVETNGLPKDASSARPSPTANRSSWYTGSWRSKASPVAQIAKENISVAQGATSEASEATRPPASVSQSVRGGSRKSVPLVAEPTRVHATSDASDQSRPRVRSDEKRKDDNGLRENKSEVVVEEAKMPPEPALEATKVGEAGARPASGTWFGWWSRPDGYGSDTESKAKKQKLDTAVEEASSTPLPGTPQCEAVDTKMKDAEGTDGTKAQEDAQTKTEQPVKESTQPSTRSWFGLWSTAQNQQAVEGQTQTKPPEQPEITVSPEPPSVEDVVNAHDGQKPEDKKSNDERPKSSGWAFWSSDRPREPAPTPGGTQKQVGELAVADTPSQSHPEAAQFNEQREESKATTKSEPKRTGSLLRPKRANANKSKEKPALSPANSSSATPTVSQIPTPSSETPPPEPSEPSKAAQKGKTPQVQTRPNLILPSLRDTIPSVPNPGYVERLTSYLAQSLRIPGSQPGPPPQHVFISSQPPKIKRAVALGIHGFFPAPLIQKVLGQPTGTSIRFANYAATSIKNWCQENQSDVKNVEIEKVALEGEGYIADRVTTLWKLLLNWLSHLRQADFILVACHSQGVPVAIMLVAKLIQLGCLSPNVRIGVCAMAGINLGPFFEYKSRLFGGTALELFEFGDTSSKNSRAYAESLEVCLRHGVRVTMVGSIDDQLVSLESSLHVPLSHPYVARAVFVDGRLHAPNFLTHLVVFALKLRNLGLSDHGLIRELSAPLAGSLVGGEGHSRVYDDPAVYKLAVEFALETTNAEPLPTTPAQADRDKAKEAAASRRASLAGLPSSPQLANAIRRGSLSASSGSLPGIAPVLAPYEPPQSSSAANPFVLPWAVRGVMEEDLVKRDPKLREEVAELVREFEEWKPTSKVLKDVRWRLEGVRSLG